MMSSAHATEARPKPSPLRVALMAVRPATLLVACASVLVGAAAALREGPVRTDALAVALFAALCIQVGTNLVNDVADAKSGADSSTRIGPVRVVQAGLASPKTVTLATVVVFALATAAGVYLVRIGGWPIVAIGTASIASAIAYTAGPWPLGYHGLGELFVMIFFGPVAVCGTTWIASGRMPMTAAVASIPVGAIASAILVVNNVRDGETDRLAGKRTLVARWGREFGVAEYRVLLGLAYASAVLLSVMTRSLGPLLPGMTLPVALVLARTIARARDGATLNRALGITASLLFAFAAFLSVGLVWG